MIEAVLAEIVDRMIRSRIPYREGGRDIATGIDCEGWLRFVYESDGIVLPEDIYEARHLFAIVARPQLMDVAVFRSVKDSPIGNRHFGVMLNRRVFTHCSAESGGVAKCEISREPYAGAFMHFARHRKYVS